MTHGRRRPERGTAFCKCWWCLWPTTRHSWIPEYNSNTFTMPPFVGKTSSYPRLTQFGAFGNGTMDMTAIDSNYDEISIWWHWKLWMVTKGGCIPLSNWAITCSNPETTGYTLYLNGLDYMVMKHLYDIMKITWSQLVMCIIKKKWL